MSTMRAAVLTEHELNGLSLRDVVLPQPAADEVLIRVETVAINQLDLNVIHGRGPGAAAKLPRVLGLDPAGTIVGVGAEVDRARIGEEVVVKPNISCGSCHRCLAGDEGECPAQTVVGVHRDGGAAEYVNVPARNAFGRRGIPAEVASAAVHSVPIVLNALDAADVVLGDRVLVTGAGGTLGRAAVALALHRGASVTAVTRRAPAVPLPTTTLVVTRAEDLSAVLAGDGAPFDVVIDVSGHAPTLAAGIAALGWGGRAVFCAASADTSLTIDTRDFYLRRKRLRGVASASYARVDRALELVAAGVVPDLIAARYGFDEIARAYLDYPLDGGGKAVVHVR